MTKKHFQKLAYELMQVRPDPSGEAENNGREGKVQYLAWLDCVHAVAAACAQSNPAFDRERFTLACLAESYSPAQHGR